MSCADCKAAQKTETGKVAYVRWKNANLIIIGCDVHLKEVFDVLAKAPRS